MRIGSSDVTMNATRTYSVNAGKSYRSSIKSGEDSSFSLNNVEKTRGSETNNGYKTINSIAELKMALLDSILATLENTRKNIFGQMYDRNNGFTLDMSGLQTQSVSTGSNYFVKQTTISEFYSEEETTSFSSEGKVITEDGREINFAVSFEMSRSFEEYTKVYKEENISLCDPLVFNFKGDATKITDQTFLFDLNGDGVSEEMHGISAGSGFLALDKNGDGIINDGTELFGTSSGDGFRDLAKYDEDGNGWIDEDDSVFKELKIWSKDEDGNDELVGIVDLGIGAIDLESVNTLFSEKNNNNETLGVMRRTGVFLYENGTAGTFSHMDFAI